MDERVVHLKTSVSAATLPLAIRFECKVCWYVYDPARGDDVWQIPPGTPFPSLPAHWTCPSCGNAKDQFLVHADD